MIPQINPVPIWYHTELLQYYWLYPLCSTLHLHDCVVTTSLYFSIPSPFSSISPTPHPSGNRQFGEGDFWEKNWRRWGSKSQRYLGEESSSLRGQVGGSVSCIFDEWQGNQRDWRRVGEWERSRQWSRPCRSVLLKNQVHAHHLGTSWKCRFWFIDGSWVLKFCISNKLSDDVNVVVLLNSNTVGSYKEFGFYSEWHRKPLERI